MITDQIVSIVILCSSESMDLNEDTQPKRRETYHHGNLRGVLIDEGALLLAEKGADGFSMREVARRAGVAVAAPSHHFGNARGLLTAIATCGFETLGDQFQIALTKHEGPIDRVIEICKFYVQMGTTHKGHAEVMFRWDLVDQSDQNYATAAGHALATLISAVDAATPVATNKVDVEHTAKTLWAAMQGFVALSLSEDEMASDRIEFAVRTLLRGVSADSSRP